MHPVHWWLYFKQFVIRLSYYHGRIVYYLDHGWDVYAYEQHTADKTDVHICIGIQVPTTSTRRNPFTRDPRRRGYHNGWIILRGSAVPHRFSRTPSCVYLVRCYQRFIANCECEHDRGRIKTTGKYIWFSLGYRFCHSIQYDDALPISHTSATTIVHVFRHDIYLFCVDIFFVV